MTEKKQDQPRKESVSDLTPEQVRRRIAERLGWRIGDLFAQIGDHYWNFAVYQNDRLMATLQISSPQSPPSENYVWRRAFKEAHIPDWTTDAGAALALCLEIAERKRWDFGIRQNTFPIALFFDPVGNVTISQRYWQMSIAEALARLALTALEGGES